MCNGVNIADGCGEHKGKFLKEKTSYESMGKQQLAQLHYNTFKFSLHQKLCKESEHKPPTEKALYSLTLRDLIFSWSFSWLPETPWWKDCPYQHLVTRAYCQLWKSGYCCYQWYFHWPQFHGLHVPLWSYPWEWPFSFTVKPKHRRFVIMGSSFSPSQSRSPPSSSRVVEVPSKLWIMRSTVVLNLPNTITLSQFLML